MVVLAFGWLTLNRVLFASKFTCRLLFRVGYLGSRRQESITSWNQVIFPDKWLGIKNSQGNPNCDWKQQQLIWLGERSQGGSSGQKVKHFKHLHIGQGDLVEIWATYIKYPTSTPTIAWRFPHDHTNPSPTQSSFPSTRVHQEECNPPYLRVHKVRKEYIYTVSEYVPR